MDTKINKHGDIGRLVGDHVVEYGRLRTPVRLRDGMRTLFLADPSGGRWTIDEFPLDIFPGDSIERWDAIHVGLTVPGEWIARDFVRLSV